MAVMESEKLYRREDFRDVLNVSLATVNNWIKTGIIPAPDKNGNFTMKTFSETISYLKKTGIKLNSRANRSQSSIKFMQKDADDFWVNARTAGGIKKRGRSRTRDPPRFVPGPVRRSS